MSRSDYECFQIDLAKNYGQTEWREDIKSIMLKAGLQDKQITFLFVDTQVSIVSSYNLLHYTLCVIGEKHHCNNVLLLVLILRQFE